MENLKVKQLLQESATGGIQRNGLILPCCLPFGKAGGLQILRCQGFAVIDYSFTLDALALKPSGFCNVGGYYKKYMFSFQPIFNVQG